MPNPQIPQGSLNRLITSVILPNFPGLNIPSSYMSKQFAKITFEGDFDKLIPTATGAVTSPEPYVMATLVVGILRTQSLAAQWKAQAELSTDLGPVSAFPDTRAYPEYDLVNCVLQHMEPEAFDGEDPVVRLTIRGIYQINSALWSA